jgi:hypothetical protein
VAETFAYDVNLEPTNVDIGFIARDLGRLTVRSHRGVHLNRAHLSIPSPAHRPGMVRSHLEYQIVKAETLELPSEGLSRAGIL